ncbi:MAG: hypothetical protein ACRDM7_05235 [Thermoleophilaceae bacterium]
MIELEFAVPDRQDGELRWNVVATLRIDGTHMAVEGDEAFAEARDIVVLDTETGQSVTFDADPERWARNLPQAFRSGDLVCRVTTDSASETVSSEALAAGA